MERLKVTGVAQSRFLWARLVVGLFYGLLSLEPATPPSLVVPIVDVNVRRDVAIESGPAVIAFLVLVIAGTIRAFTHAQHPYHSALRRFAHASKDSGVIGFRLSGSAENRPAATVRRARDEGGPVRGRDPGSGPGPIRSVPGGIRASGAGDHGHEGMLGVLPRGRLQWPGLMLSPSQPPGPRQDH